MTILTRKDTVGHWQPYDSIAWALEVHLKEPDTGEYNYGILHGNEDCPLRIQLWKKDPEWKDPCDRDWRPPETRPTLKLGTPNSDQFGTKPLKLSGTMRVIPIEPEPPEGEAA